MAAHDHRYSATVTWTGNQGSGTSGYKAYSRDHDIAIPGKLVIAGSSDPAFRGDATRHNPEDLLVASLSACHMLWYLHLCAVNGVAVTAYRDDASGTMTEGDGHPGRFTEVTLRPHVTIAAGSDPAKAESLHHAAHEQCFVANSMNFPVKLEAKTEVGA